MKFVAPGLPGKFDRVAPPIFCQMPYLAVKVAVMYMWLCALPAQTLRFVPQRWVAFGTGTVIFPALVLKQMPTSFGLVERQHGRVRLSKVSTDAPMM